MRYTRLITAAFAGSMIAVGSASAQTPAADPSAKLAEVLPAEIADHVLATIAAARARGLPAQALESRALKYAARGVNPQTIRAEIAAQSQRMETARSTLQSARTGQQVADEEIEAGADVLAKGIDGAAVSELAQSAPSGRSLTVPLFVLGSLVDRGLPSDEALQRVVERLQARASDAELETLPAQAAAGRANRPEQAGRGAGAAGRPAGAGPGAGAAGGVGISGPPSGTPGPTSRPSTPRGRP